MRYVISHWFYDREESYPAWDHRKIVFQINVAEGAVLPFGASNGRYGQVEQWATPIYSEAALLSEVARVERQHQTNRALFTGLMAIAGRSPYTDQTARQHGLPTGYGLEATPAHIVRYIERVVPDDFLVVAVNNARSHAREHGESDATAIIERCHVAAAAGDLQKELRRRTYETLRCEFEGT